MTEERRKWNTEYERNPKRVQYKKQYNRNKRITYLEWINTTYKQDPCMDCGINYPPECLDFDHRPGEVKLFDLSNACHKNVEKVLAEIAKCDLVCSNCHRIRTKKRIN